MNFNYNGMNAQDVARKIIERENSYLSMDVSNLSFEDKCRIVRCNNGTYHPLFRNRDFSATVAQITPELVRRAEANDANALYYMAAIFGYDLPRSDSRLAYLERAMEAGSLEALVQYASRFKSIESSDAFKLLEKALDLYAAGQPFAEGEKTLFRCYLLLIYHAKTPEERERYRGLADTLAKKMVLEGDFYPLLHVCTSDAIVSEEKAFWKNVRNIVGVYFYDRGAKQFDYLLKYRDSKIDSVQNDVN